MGELSAWLARAGLRRRQILTTAGTVLLLLVVGLGLRACSPSSGPVLVVAAGGMACDPTDPHYADGRGRDDQCVARALAAQALRLEPDRLLGLGDYQYELPTSEAYRTAYASSWGRLRDATIPARGNQEYKVHDAETFTSYFGDHSGDPRGYWSTDLGDWHVVVLDSNCTTVFGGCAEGSAQQLWLADDLASHSQRCTVALMHHPRWSSGIAGDNQTVEPLWRTLADGGADLLLSAHEHDYERFPPLDAAGRPSAAGLEQYVVGVGGQAHYRPEVGSASWRKRTVTHRSDFVDFDHHGFLALRLNRRGWHSELHTLGGGVQDRHQGRCS